MKTDGIRTLKAGGVMDGRGGAMQIDYGFLMAQANLQCMAESRIF